MRVGGAGDDQVLAALNRVDVAIARERVERDHGRRAENFQLTAAHVVFGDTASHHGDRHVVGAIGQRREAGEQTGVQAPSFGARVVAQASRHRGDGAGDGLAVNTDRDLVGACQGDVIAADRWVCAHRNEFGRLASQCGRGCISTVGHDAVREHVVHRGHIGVGRVHEQAEVVFDCGVARHVGGLHAHAVGVAVVQRDGVGRGQGDGPGVGLRACTGLHGGGVSDAIERDLHALPRFGIGRALNLHVRSHRGEHRAALGSIKLAGGVGG